MTDLWDDIVKIALIGTERQKPTFPAADGPLGEAFAALSNCPPEAALLGAGAVLSVYRQAGKLPAKRDEKTHRIAPSDPEETPRVGPAAAFHLSRILNGEHRPILAEWLMAAAAAGRRVPEEFLPGVFDFAKAQPDLRVLVEPVMGHRGRWLAAQNPAWDFAAEAADDESLWETATRAARLALLGRLRPIRPARVIALLRTTWAQEAADDRAAFLSTLSTNLGPHDEPFLEEALDDRSKVVRRQAAMLLAAIPESALCRRMADRVRPLMTWQAGKKPRIEITLPREPDATAERDGVDVTKPKQGLGQKAWWVFQMIALVPPRVWAQEWKQTPEKIIAAAIQGNEWEGPLLEAWARAAARTKDSVWAEALWNHAIPGKYQLGSENIAAGLLAAVPADRREALLMKRLQDGPSLLADESSVLNLLQQHRVPWGEALARAVLEATKSAVLGGGGWRLRSLLSQFALYLPPHLLSEAITGWPVDQEKWGHWKTAVDEMLSVLQFRHDMLEGMAT